MSRACVTEGRRSLWTTSTASQSPFVTTQLIVAVGDADAIMRSLPFPVAATFDHEVPSEHGTPFSPASDIPIDPALAGPLPIDPAIMGDEAVQLNVLEQGPPVHIPEDFIPPHPRHYSQEPSQYDQGPRGDPFAPQPAPYLHIQEEVIPPPTKPPKRKRKPRREPECGFCQGDDKKNKEAEPEAMVTCEECGRSGHPSCLQLGAIADTIRSYPWKCIECKTCEICQEKGDDERILLCDFCDRGWHMDCMQPPLEEMPPGTWHCPMCPPSFLPLESEVASITNSDPQDGDEATAEPEVDVEVDDGDDDSSEDSSDSESESDGTNTVQAPTPRQRPSQRIKKPPKRRIEHSTPRPLKRIRLRSPAAHPLVVRLRIPPKGKGKEREEDPDRNIFEDLLSPAHRDMSKTEITDFDRARFDKSCLAAEHHQLTQPDPPIAGPSSRPLRSHALQHITIPSSIPARSPVPSTPGAIPHTPSTIPATPSGFPAPPSTLRIRTIRFGKYDIHPWYDAPFPEEFSNIPDGRLWFCEFCLKYMRSGFAFGRHNMKCKTRHPPGDEIYRDGAMSIFEVDGRKNKIYCQNLCLLSKMFLDHKSLFYDVEPFLFYVITETDDMGARFVGYFSKEKCSPKDYNVSCIMALPVRQRQGWGNFLIDFSYLLSKKEQRAGSPEKPLSGLGQLGYKNYWTLALMRYLHTSPDNPTLEAISKGTSMTIEDIYNTLHDQGMISVQSATPPMRPTPGQAIKFPRGRKNGIARRHLQRQSTLNKEEEAGSKANTPFVPPTRYQIIWDPEKVQHYLEAWEKKGYMKLKPERLKWTPFVLARAKAGGEVLQVELGAGMGALNGVAETPISVTEQVDKQTPAPGPAEPSVSVSEAAPTETHYVSDTPAARLFDDLIAKNPETPVPKKQLRSRVKGGEVPRSVFSRTQSSRNTITRTALQRHTRSVSARPITGIDGAVNGTAPQTDELAEQSSPDIPAKRRRGRARIKPPDDALSAVSESGRMTASPSPSRPLTRVKRRRIESPESETPSEHVEDHAEPPGGPTHSNGHINPVSEVGQEDVPHHSSGSSGSVNNGAQSLRVETTSSMSELDTQSSLAQSQPPDDEIKSEEADTPLTGITSRHSVPSDDTLFVVETAHGIGTKDSGGSEIIRAVHSPTSQTTGRESAGQDSVPSCSAPALTDLDQYSDLDAEGELAHGDLLCDRLFGDDFRTKQPAFSQAEPQHTHERFTPVHCGSQLGLWKLTNVNSNAYTRGSDPSMAFGHLQRDPNLQTNVSNVSSLNQALGSHLNPTISGRPQFHDGGAYRLSDSPPTILDSNGAPRSAQPIPGSSHTSPIHEFSVLPTNETQTTSVPKRKQTDGLAPSGSSQSGKRRREGDDMGDPFDTDAAHGSKHWTDDEKTKLFNWLMGSGEDNHWNALRATKNSCLRECAIEVFGGKKTYQALKGCYERNFNLFKQIYAFESFHVQLGNSPVSFTTETDRLREYERRLQIARKGGCDVGNVGAKTIDHWHRSGWYTLFHRRWNGDPATTRPANRQNNVPGATNSHGGEDDDDDSLEVTEPIPILQPQIQPQSAPSHPRPQVQQVHSQARPPAFVFTSQPSIANKINTNELPIQEAGPSNTPLSRAVFPTVPSPSSDASVVNFALPQNMMAACLQLLQAQVQHSKLKLEYLRRREEREERDSNARKDAERARLEREAAEWEHTKETANVKHRAQLATDVLANPVVDGSTDSDSEERMDNKYYIVLDRERVRHCITDKLMLNHARSQELGSIRVPLIDLMVSFGFSVVGLSRPYYRIITHESQSVCSQVSEVRWVIMPMMWDSLICEAAFAVSRGNLYPGGDPDQKVSTLILHYQPLPLSATMCFPPGPVSIPILTNTLCLVTFIAYIAWRNARRYTLKDICGPPSHSFWLGSEKVHRSAKQVGDLEFRWAREYGPTWMAKGCLGVFKENRCHRNNAPLHRGEYFDHRLSYLLAVDHQRHRKIMNPAFGAAQLRTFLPVFRRSAARLSQKWKDMIQLGEKSDGCTMNVSETLSRMTLDVIGEVAFDYRFGVLNDNGVDNELVQAFNNLFIDTMLYQSSWDIIFKSTWRFLPQAVLRYLKYLPYREYRRFATYLQTAIRTGRTIINEKAAGTEKGGKDIISILAPCWSRVMILLPHLSRGCLYELSKHPEDQQRIRDEIKAARANAEARGDNDLLPSDFNNMDFTNAVIKVCPPLVSDILFSSPFISQEGLRLHPIVPTLIREADSDDVIPLSHPIKTRSGRIINQIPISKGQGITASICTYNRLQSVWGEDADKWNPSRFLDDGTREKSSLGVFANLSCSPENQSHVFQTKAAGLRACIGWRFAVLEMQAVLVELVENFEYRFPEGVEIIRLNAGLMAPMVEGKMHEGVQMPLEVSVIAFLPNGGHRMVEGISSKLVVESKVKTKAKTRYLKQKKSRRQIRKSAAPKQTNSAAQRRGETDEEDSNDTESEDHAPRERPSNGSRSKELKETQEGGKDERPKKKRRKSSLSYTEEGGDHMSEIEGVEVANEVDSRGPLPAAAPRTSSKFPESHMSLPVFSLPTLPDAPPKSILALQGLDQALVEAEVVNPSSRLPIIPKGDDARTGLSERTRRRLIELGITELFAGSSTTRRPLYTPFDLLQDVCVSAPTGSGKTLAYVLPIVEVMQVREIVEAIAKGRGLKIGTATGQHSFAHEQSQLVADMSAKLSGGSSKVDILICTPGRLIDHLNGTPNFSLQHLRFLVIDEADRLLAQSFQDWLAQVLAATQPSPRMVPETTETKTPAPLCDSLAPAFLRLHGEVDLHTDIDEKKDVSCQKLLFSATLTSDPGKLAALDLRNPKYFVVQGLSEESEIDGIPNIIAERFTMPEALKEHMIICEAPQKPLMLFHLAHNHSVRNALVFTKSSESASRLVRLFEFFEDCYLLQRKSDYRSVVFE
ncbi:hypothetical protein DFJ58DRAFT_848085 [Suillus subalutaceus]|uniref:uncharacterized protein n=1 Tax=Suillus subalutaceus TaxID=48586 RepID=UPI001B885E78|nr:uncharacterized protein DFJ58DRAFT_848085 [Suillus subalutaceus]KAG1831991.1 hypothetical protein DFJ58DRAFT_848085 [Suillus subalutaceus]